MFSRLSAWLDRTAFPLIENPNAEAHKVALLRIATGLVLVWRCAFMLRDSWYYFDPVPLGGSVWPLQALASGGQLLLALGLTFGVAPAGCAVLLLVTHPAFSSWAGTYNLGPMLLAPLLGALAVLETGRFAFAARRSFPPSASLYRVVYVILFVGYAGLNFQALLYHVRDPAWTGGQTTAVLFTNSYLSEFYGAFRAWESFAPGVYALFSKIVGVLQSLFQLGMLPLMLSRWGRRFVQLWGWAFILGSLADIQLSILPVVEVILWLLLFTPARWFSAIGRPVTGESAPDPRLRRVTAGLFCGTYAALLLFFYVNAVTEFALGRAIGAWNKFPVLFYSGLVAPNVFNRDDLSMGDRWPVIERLDGGHRGPLPLNGPEGERLAYHRSDLLYFGNSLPWRRGMVDAPDLVAFHQPGGDGYRYAQLLARYDYRRQGDGGPGLYRVRLFRNHASEAARGADPDRYRAEPVLEFELRVGPETP